MLTGKRWRLFVEELENRLVPATLPTEIAAVDASVAYKFAAQRVSLSAQVTSGAGSVTDGTVAFAILDGTTTLGAAIVRVARGLARASVSLPAGLVVGSYQVVADYTSLKDFLPSSDSGSLTVSAAESKLTAKALSTTYSPGDQTILIGAMVTSKAGVINEGTVTFVVRDGGGNMVGSEVVSPTVVKGKAGYSFVLSGTPAGDYSISANYAGSTNLQESSASTTLKIKQATTKTVTDAATATISALDQTVALHATVTSKAGAVAEGSVTFTIKKGAVVVGAAVAAPGAGGSFATDFTVPGGTVVGTYTVSAGYEGAGNFTKSLGNKTLKVDKAASTVVAQDAQATFSEDIQDVALVASVTSPLGTVGDGKVTFILKNTAGKLVGRSTSATVSAGQATVLYKLPAKTEGPCQIWVTYAGGANVLASKEEGTHALTINPPAPGPLQVYVTANYYGDANLDRGEVLGLFEHVQAAGNLTTADFKDLKTIVGAYTMPDDVKSLAGKIVNGDKANTRYQGAPLGNLMVGDVPAKLDKLVNKWLFGLDRPALLEGSYQQFVGVPLFDGQGVNYYDVSQGSVGDCWLLGQLAAVAVRTPDVIEDMFNDNGDGSFSVRFFKGTAPTYVTVDNFLPNSFAGARTTHALPGGGTSQELWVALAEKAYAQLNESGFIGRDGTNTYADLDEGGDCDEAFPFLTGKTASSGAITASTSSSVVVNLWNQGLYITLGTKNGPDIDANGVVTLHCYALVGYDPSTQEFELFNPWGLQGDTIGSATVWGLKKVPWSTIVQSFNEWAKGTLASEAGAGSRWVDTFQPSPEQIS